MMKRVWTMVLALVLLVALSAGCGSKYEAVDIKITAIAGPTGVGLVDLMQK